jgi:hypothetical protein
LANNYYGLVRPELEFRNSINNLQQQYTGLNQAFNNPTTIETPFPGTGHHTSFLNYSHYYGLRGRAPYGGSGSVGSASAAGAGPVGTQYNGGTGSYGAANTVGTGNFGASVPSYRR